MANEPHHIAAFPAPGLKGAAMAMAFPARILLTSSESAAFLGISERTFLSLRDAPYMPAPIVLGPRLHRWSADELRSAVANMPRQTEREQPESLLRARIERMKATGAAQ